VAGVKKLAREEGQRAFAGGGWHALLCIRRLTSFQSIIYYISDMSVTWLPDCELARVHFFEAVDIITDEEFDLLQTMREQPPVDVDGWLDMLDNLCDASDDECAKEEEEEEEEDADSGDDV
jgi:hypothetical protein